MCGIVAMLSSDAGVSPDQVAKAAVCLRHRGPDDLGHWVAAHRRVGLGHSRLSLVGLENGQQPIASEDGQIRVVVNGEFYGYRDTKSELERRGHRFRTASDSEIVVHLYEEYGLDCVEYLRGEFAFVLWDERAGRMMAVRDRFGIKPLFYAQTPTGLYLASEAKALFSFGVPARWDHRQYYQQLFISTSQDRTLFDNVRQVPAGCYLLASAESGGERTNVRRYWDLDYPRRDDRASSCNSAEHIEAVRSELVEAVRVRTQADVPVSALLSGGLDSSAIVGMVSASTSQRLRAFTVRFDDEDYDEGDIARETARQAQASFHETSVRGSDLVSHLREAVWHGEMLGINGHAVARYLVSRAVRDAGCKAVLAGDGSDEIFGGYNSTRRDARVYGDRVPSRTDNGSAAFLSAASREPLAGVASRLGFVPSWIERMALGRSVFHAITAEEYEREFDGHDIYGEFLEQFDVPGQLAGRECVIQSLYLWLKSILPNYTLACDRLEMAHGVEVRLPFLDHKLFSAVRAIPVSLLVQGTVGKHVLREAAKPYITERVYSRPKHSFAAPPWSLGEGSDVSALVQDTLRGPTMDAIPFFDKAAIVSLLDGMKGMKEDVRLKLEAPLFMVLCTCLLHETYRL